MAIALVLSFDPDLWSFLGARGPEFEFKLSSMPSCVALIKFFNLSAPLCPHLLVCKMRIIAMPLKGC